MQFPIRPKNKFLINITSLIDVLFMLLLFVLVSSSFIENPGIKIDLPGIIRVKFFYPQRIT